MMIANLIAAAAALTLTIASVVGGQTKGSVESETAPPKLLVLVYQRFSFDKGSDRDKWEIATARACQKLAVPNLDRARIGYRRAGSAVVRSIRFVCAIGKTSCRV